MFHKSFTKIYIRMISMKVFRVRWLMILDALSLRRRGRAIALIVASSAVDSLSLSVVVVVDRSRRCPSRRLPSSLPQPLPAQVARGGLDIQHVF